MNQVKTIEKQAHSKIAQTSPGKTDDFFTEIGNNKPYFKAAFQGMAGTGKTYSAALMAKGLHKRIGSKKPIVIFDTEKASKFLKPMFAEAGIEVLVRESRSLADLIKTMQKMDAGLADILIIDSISHVWEETLSTFQKSKNRTSLQFQDWGIIKPAWKKNFSDPFVNGEYHALFTGRAGYEYSNELNEDTGKREIYKSGVKMKVEGETAYEPDVLINMERYEKILGENKDIHRTGTVIKDRSTLLDGKTFKNPSYEDFAPAIDALLENPVPRDALIAPEGDTAMLFQSEDDTAKWRRARDTAIEELEGLMYRIEPASNGKGKQLKLDMLDEVFGTTSMTAIGGMKPSEIMEGYRKIGEKAVKMGVAKIIEVNGRKRLVRQEKPADEPKEKPTAKPSAKTTKVGKKKVTSKK